MQKYKKHYKIEKNLSLRDLLEIFMQTSLEDSADKTIVKKYFKDNNLSWMIYKWKVQIYGNITKTDYISKTWPSYFDKISTYREFTLERDGHILAKATAIYVIVDMKNKKLIEIPQIVKDSYQLIQERNFKKIEKASIKGDIYCEKNFSVEKEQIDLNGHVHNTSYIFWLEKCFENNSLIKKLKVFTISYMKEIHYPNKVNLLIYKDGENYNFSIKTKDFNAKGKCIFNDWKVGLPLLWLNKK